MSSMLGSRMILNLRGVIMRPSAFANMDNINGLMTESIPEEFGAISLSGGTNSHRGFNRRSSIGRAGATGTRSRNGEDVELSEMRRWQEEIDLKPKEDDSSSTKTRPRSAGDLSGGVQVHISTVKWEDDLESEGWNATKR
jgi:hypothetical protein